MLALTWYSVIAVWPSHARRTHSIASCAGADCHTSCILLVVVPAYHQPRLHHSGTVYGHCCNVACRVQEAVPYIDLTDVAYEATAFFGRMLVAILVQL